MGVDLGKLASLRLDGVEQVLTRRDTILYALGVGLGADPCDEDQLRFLYEDGLRALPTMAITLAYPNFMQAFADAGVSTAHVLHAEQAFVLHRALPAEGTIVGSTRIVRLSDKGPGKGLLIGYETVVTDGRSGEPICTLASASLCRADGGAGGTNLPGPEPHPIPQRPPEGFCDLPTLPQAALIYRLSGDWNPLHALPALARQAGFERPILHGRCTFGVAGHALLRTCCGYDPDRLTAMQARFSSPVYPGETIRTEYWRDGAEVSFRARVLERGRVVLDHGLARIR